MANRVHVETSPPPYPGAGPRVRADDDFEQMDWVDLPPDMAGLPATALVHAAADASGNFLGFLETAHINQTAAYLDDANFDLEAFFAWRADPARAAREAQRLDDVLVDPAPTRPAARI